MATIFLWNQLGAFGWILEASFVMHQKNHHVSLNFFNVT
jgi:hypothetical protein